MRATLFWLEVTVSVLWTGALVLLAYLVREAVRRALSRRLVLRRLQEAAEWLRQ